MPEDSFVRSFLKKSIDSAAINHDVKHNSQVDLWIFRREILLLDARYSIKNDLFLSLINIFIEAIFVVRLGNFDQLIEQELHDFSVSWYSIDSWIENFVIKKSVR